jgi:hypothetical protein
MNVLELFRKLSFGEFSNIAIGNDGNGTISDGAKPRVVMHANEGLQQLYSRFILSEKSLLLTCLSHVSTYHLDPIHALSQASEDNPNDIYLIDSPDDPFIGDVVKVLEAWDNTQKPMPLNQASNPRSLHTPKFDVVQVPMPMVDQVIALNYQAYHPTLLDAGDDYEEQEIFLPRFLESALTAYIAHKVYADMGTDTSVSKSQLYLNRYEMACKGVEEKDLVSNTRSNSGNLFELNGWI